MHSGMFQKTPVKPLKVYLAGPDVFKKDPVQVGKEKKLALKKAGHVGKFPMDPEIKDFAHDKKTAYTIAKGNEDLMDSCQVILINMTPWHGPSMDVGTAFEVGYMKHKAKYTPTLLIGYYEGEVQPDFTKRVAEMHYGGNVHFAENGDVTDKEGISLENFDLPENLMIAAAIHHTGGEIFHSFDEAVNNISRLWQLKEQNIVELKSAAECN